MATTKTTTSAKVNTRWRGGSTFKYEKFGYSSGRIVVQYKFHTPSSPQNSIVFKVGNLSSNLIKYIGVPGSSSFPDGYSKNTFVYDTGSIRPVTVYFSKDGEPSPQRSSMGASTTPTIRWAISTEPNDPLYINPTSDTVGHEMDMVRESNGSSSYSQNYKSTIAHKWNAGDTSATYATESKTLYFTNYKYRLESEITETLLPDTDYYIYIWTVYTSYRYYDWPNACTMTIEFEGEVSPTYYIYNGGQWHHYVPHVYTLNSDGTASYKAGEMHIYKDGKWVKGR